MNKLRFSLFLFLSFSLNLLAQNFELVWEDGFDGTELDASKWAHDLGTGHQYGLTGWGNGELQCYQRENTLVSDGTLKIIAKEEPDGVADPFSTRVMNYSSSKIITAELYTFRYGRVQARIKTVVGQGFWPAFWMLPTDGNWPCDGEIDIMEQGNRITGNTEAEITTGAAHLGPCSEGGSTYRTFSRTIDSGSYADDFHVYEVRWEPNKISWYVDDVYLFHVTPDDYPSEYTWPFNTSEWFLMINLAIDQDGPNAETQFPSQIEVDWVRVYQESDEATECTDSEAHNYNADALTDDGSCLYEVNFEVDMNCASFRPEYVSVTGIDETACGSGTILQEVGDSKIWTGTAYLPQGTHAYNYCADGGDHHEDLLTYAKDQADWSCVASTDSTTFAKREVMVDGSTQVSEVWSSCTTCVVNSGCIYPSATNYNPNANVQAMDDNGGWFCNFESCDQAPVEGCLWIDYFFPFDENTNRGLCQSWGGLICSDSPEVYGCMDANALNYSALANIQSVDQWDNILCTYATCDDVPETGCKYSAAFAPFHANFGAGNCSEYGGTPCTDPSEGCMDVKASNYSTIATKPGKDQYGNSVCIYTSCDDIPDAGGCMYKDAYSPYNEYFTPENCVGYGGTACGEYEVVVPEGEGCMDTKASNYDAEATSAGQDRNGNSVCIYTSCDDIPDAEGCMYADAYAPYNEYFTPENCVGYGGTACTNTVAIEELEWHFTLVPNPSEGHFYVKAEEALEALEIYDLTGHLVYQNTFHSKEAEFDLSHLSSGSYFLKGTFLSGQSTTKSLLICK